MPRSSACDLNCGTSLERVRLAIGNSITGRFAPIVGAGGPVSSDGFSTFTVSAFGASAFTSAVTGDAWLCNSFTRAKSFWVSARIASILGMKNAVASTLAWLPTMPRLISELTLIS